MEDTVPKNQVLLPSPSGGVWWAVDTAVILRLLLNSDLLGC